MPILVCPGTMMPGVFGPMSRVGRAPGLFDHREQFVLHDPFGDADRPGDGVGRSLQDGVRRQAGRDEDECSPPMSWLAPASEMEL